MTTQPICEGCRANLMQYGGGAWAGLSPYRAHPAHSRICCRCGAATTSGLYIRIDPASVPYPSED